MLRVALISSTRNTVLSKISISGDDRGWSSKLPQPLCFLSVTGRVMAKKRKRQHYSGIGGQAVLEGIMMRNKSQMAVAVRKPNGEIEIGVDEVHGIGDRTIWTKIPFIRGVLAFIDSLVIGMKAMEFSSSFYDEEEAKGDKTPEQKAREEKLFTGITIALSLVLAVGLFVILPMALTSLLGKTIRSDAAMAILEGVVRLAIFLAYMVGISLMKDIRRLYGYHGAEHKCINCIESGKPLTVENVMSSSRFHKRCGSSFIVLVVIISIILFFFIRVESYGMRILVRILLIPVIAGISFEFLRYAGRHNNTFVDIISAPGVWLQHITTKEPDEGMAEVAIAAVDAVFDWRGYLKRSFGYTDEELAYYEQM